MEHEFVKTAGVQSGEKMDFSIFHIMTKLYLEANQALLLKSEILKTIQKITRQKLAEPQFRNNSNMINIIIDIPHWLMI